MPFEGLLVLGGFGGDLEVCATKELVYMKFHSLELILINNGVITNI